MSLLPSSAREFHTKAYWDRFFQQRRGKDFEWYGSYRDLRPFLLASLPPVSFDVPVLVIGCGNSALSAALYQEGYKGTVSIDFSPVVINEMKTKHPTMQWKIMDATKLEYEEGAMSSVVDKGTLDAMHSEEGNEEALKRVEAMLAEAGRVLRDNAQSHVLRTLLGAFFKPEFAVEIRSVHLSDVVSDLHPFVVTIRKLPASKHSPSPSPITVIPTAPNMPLTADSIPSCIEIVRSLQMQTSILRHAARGSQVSVELSDPAAPLSSPLFVIHVVPSPLKVAPNGACACFIVPRGREREWMFGSDEGRRELTQQAGYSRLLVAVIGRSAKEDKLKTLEEVQRSLDAHVLALAPPGSTSIPYLTAAEGVSACTTLCSVTSELSGPIVVEESVDEDDPSATHRRLVFARSPHLVQIEAKILSKKGQDNAIDYSTVSERAQTMLGALIFAYPLFLAPSTSNDLIPPLRMLSIGGGGGALEMLLTRTCSHISAELDPCVRDLCVQYFGLVESERLRVRIDDGLNVVSQLAHSVRKGDASSQRDLIIIDVDAKDLSSGLSAPPQEFVTPEFLTDIRTVLTARGLLLLDVACRSEQLRAELEARLSAAFATVLLFSVGNDVNAIVAAFAVPPKFLTQAQGAADRFDKSFPLPRPLTWRSLLDDLQHSFMPLREEPKGNREGKGKRGKGGKGRGKGRR